MMKVITFLFKFVVFIFKILLVLILFIFTGVSFAFITPFFSAESYENNATPCSQFRVIVEVKDNINDQTILRSIRWDEFIELRQTANYKIYRSKSEGRCDNISFWCKAKNISPKKQLIELRYAQENFHLYNRYYVVDNKIYPLYCRIMDRGHAMMGGLFSLFGTPVIFLSLRFCVRKYKKKKSNKALSTDS